jgi:dephospho-CoA kinase
MGSGKSLVASLFAARGAKVISGDRLGHEALEQPDIQEQLVRRWGSQVLDEQGSVDRRRLGTIVFDNPAERRALEALVFPWIEQRFREEIAAAESEPDVPLIVFDAAIMLEAGWNSVCDRLVYVDAPRDVRLRRLAGQRGWSEKEVEARENAQLSVAEKRNRADHVIDNSGLPEQAARQVDELLGRWGIGQ